MFGRTLRLVATLVLGITAILPARADAALITVSLAESNGPLDETPPFEGFEVGTFTYLVPAGEEIVAAQISGTFGNGSSVNSSGVDLFVDSLLVGQCVQFALCYSSQSPTPWSYVFTASQFGSLSDGSALFFAQQTSPYNVRLSSTTLEITTRPTAAVPEPASLVLLGVGLLGTGLRRLRKRA